MSTNGRFLICVVTVLATPWLATAQSPPDDRSGKEAEAPAPAAWPAVPGFGNEFEARPVSGFGAADAAPQESSAAAPSPSPSRAKRAPTAPTVAARSSLTALAVRSLAAPPSRAAAAKPVARRFRTAAELLPDGLPDWFRKQDANGDGQISMAEYAKNWTEAKVAEYGKWDLNGDGVIEPSEALKVLGIDPRQQAKSDANAASAVANAAARTETPSPARPDDLGPPPNERRADSLVRIFLMRYDRDRSGALEAAEWPALPWRDDVHRWDTNHDRRLTADELAVRFAGPQP
jgi:hypothetical protein